MDNQATRLPLLQFSFQNTNPLARLKFLIRKFTLAACQELIVVLDSFGAPIQMIERERAKKNVTSILSAHSAQPIERGQALRILPGDHEYTGQLAPGFDRIGFYLGNG